MTRRCAPDEIREEAAAAQKRLDDAVNALLNDLAAFLPGEDEFHRQMVDLIEADKRKTG